MALSARAKSILVLMLVEAGLPIGSMVAFALLFGQGVPAFVYVIPIIWIALFILSFAKLRWAIIGAIIMAVLGIIVPIIPAALKVPNPLAQAVGLPLCPFALAGIIVSIAIIPLAFKTLREIRSSNSR
jgi:hypothetical protein